MLACAFVAILVVARYLVEPSRRKLTVLCILAAAVVLTRWVGVVVGLTAAVLILWQRAWTIRQRLERAGSVVASAAGAGLAWTAFGAVAAGHMPRQIAYHAPPGFFGTVAGVLSASFIHWRPPVGTNATFLSLAGVLVIGVVWARRRRAADIAPGPRDRVWMVRALVVFGVIYVGVVFVARTFFDASIPTVLRLLPYGSVRIFVPLIPVTLILGLAAFDVVARRILGEGREAWSTGAVVVVSLALIFIPLSSPVTAVRAMRALVRNDKHPSNPMFAAVRALPPQVPVASNDAVFVYLGTGRPLLSLPSRFVVVTARRNKRFVRDVRELAVILVRHNGVLVERRGILDLSQASTSDFERYATLTVAGTYGDFTLYRVNARQP